MHVLCYAVYIPNPIISKSPNMAMLIDNLTLWHLENEEAQTESSRIGFLSFP